MGHPVTSGADVGTIRVLINGFENDADVPIVPGAHAAYGDCSHHEVISMASCPTSFLTSVAKVLQEPGVVEGAVSGY